MSPLRGFPPLWRNFYNNVTALRFSKCTILPREKYNTYLHTVNKYVLLDNGSALGKGVGLLLAVRKPLDIHSIANYSIAILGFKTTANRLLTLAFRQAKNKTALLFSDIEDAVITGQYDIGLMLHEGGYSSHPNT